MARDKNKSAVEDATAQVVSAIKKRVFQPVGVKKKKGRAPLLRPPATASEISKAESQLGFELPFLLKTLYMEVANGGFGPGEGFLSVPSRNVAAGLNLVKTYRNCNGRGWQWPTHLVPVVYAGCDVFFCLDYDSLKNRVVMFDGDLGGLEESDVSEPHSQLAYSDSPMGVCFRTISKSFHEFLEMWLEEESQLFRPT
jgi:SMI1 / KNR4 family (SUKH-1)